jgi:tetratricopeptide (TPR) repeat protein
MEVLTMRLQPTSLAAVVLGAILVTAPAFAQQHTGHEKLGQVNFANTCSPAVQADLTRAVALLHSFWWGATIKAFTEVAQKDPSCGIAYWGVAMGVLENPFGWPPTPKMLSDGSAAVSQARAAGAKSQRELDYIAAIEVFYKDYDKVEHRPRAVAYEKAMEQLSARYPNDREAAIFYALALNATAQASDRAYTQQLKAAGILEAVFREQPDHPGAAHYLIHSYDYPPIAEKGLDAARRYATIAPAAPHAQHMPSHIFTRRGYWEDSIRSNLASAAASDNDFDRFHAWDYLAYGYLQLGQDRLARGVLDQILSVEKPNVLNFATAFALAAIPSRYALERGQWADSVALALKPGDFPWARFPQAEAILVFSRGLGAARSGNLAQARDDQTRLAALRDGLTAAKIGYWADQVDIQRLVVAGWIARGEGRNDDAVQLIRAAADREDATEKHPVTPGSIVPAREALGELLLDLGRPAEALQEFEASQRKDPNRLRGYAGAARAAELSGDAAKAKRHYTMLVTLTAQADSQRAEITRAKEFLAKP